MAYGLRITAMTPWRSAERQRFGTALPGEKALCGSAVESGAKPSLCHQRRSLKKLVAGSSGHELELKRLSFLYNASGAAEVTAARLKVRAIEERK